MQSDLEPIVMGPNELDLGILGKVTNELPVHQVQKPKVEGEDEDIEKLRSMIEFAKRVKQADLKGGFKKWFIPGTPYGIDKLHKHREFLFAGKKYHERYASFSNQSGKTTMASYELTLHLTGLYPDWWEGRRFPNPISAFAVGSTNETTRNIIQKELIGEVSSWGTGMIPLDLIEKTTSKSGVSNAIDMLQVRHVSGGISTLQFKSYDQGRRAFEGVKLDVCWLDEMPDMEIYSECYTRTITKNGIMLVTATPLDGITPLVLSFYAQADFLPADTPIPSVIRMAKEDYLEEQETARAKGEPAAQVGSTSKAVILGGWNDAPWLSEEAKVRILSASPPHLRQARSTGVPGDTGGMIYPIPLNDITVDDFPIPSHYRLINGLDPGWVHPTGAVFCAVDPDTDTMYVYADYHRSKAEPVIHAEAIKTKSKWAEAPIIFDFAGYASSAADGKQVGVIFKQHGLRLINAEKAVEAGIAAVWERMSTGKLKVFKSCRQLLKEISTYQRDERGKILKEGDDVIDALRYVVLGVKHARTPQMGRSHTVNNFGRFRGNVSGKKYFR